MKPEREFGLADILDRILNKGLILNADLIITVAGVPLIGVSLSAAVSSVETMLDYGMMDAWDQKTREWYKENYSTSDIPLAEGEEIIRRTFGSLWYSRGIISSWRPGFWYLTNKRLILWRRVPEGALLDMPLDEIEALRVKTEIDFGKEREEINLLFREAVVRIRVSDVTNFRGAIKEAVAAKPLS